MFKDDSSDIAKSTAYIRKTPSPSGDPADNLEMLSIPQVTEPESMNNQEEEPAVEETESPQMNGWVCLGLLLSVTAVRPSTPAAELMALTVIGLQLVGVTAEFLVGSINGLTESGHITKEFVSIILLPIVGNAAGASLILLYDQLQLTVSVFILLHRTCVRCDCCHKGQNDPEYRRRRGFQYRAQLSPSHPFH